MKSHHKRSSAPTPAVRRKTRDETAAGLMSFAGVAPLVPVERGVGT